MPSRVGALKFSSKQGLRASVEARIWATGKSLKQKPFRLGVVESTGLAVSVIAEGTPPNKTRSWTKGSSVLGSQYRPLQLGIFALTLPSLVIHRPLVWSCGGGENALQHGYAALNKQKNKKSKENI
jgi:hypothetical protein